LSSPRYHNLFKYSWFKSDCTNERPEGFKNPVEFNFKKFINDIKNCNNIAVVICLRKKSLWLLDFFIEYHCIIVMNTMSKYKCIVYKHLEIISLLSTIKNYVT